MSTSTVSSDVKIVETAEGVRYVLRSSNAPAPLASALLLLVVRIPLLAIALALWFLWQSFGRVANWLIATSFLFVGQMLFNVRAPWRLSRAWLWQSLITLFGRNEIELRGDKLLLGSRLGFLRSGSKRNVQDIERIVVYVYQSVPAANARQQQTESPPQPPTERAVLAIETGEPRSWLLTDGFLREETLGLAEDLHGRLASMRISQPLPRPTVMETQERTLYPPLDEDFYRRKRPLWLAIHIAGIIGLVALTAIAMQTGALQQSRTKLAFFFGWLMEFLVLRGIFSLRANSSNDIETEHG